MQELQPARCLFCRRESTNFIWLKYGEISPGVPLVIKIALCDRHEEADDASIETAIRARNMERTTRN